MLLLSYFPSFVSPLLPQGLGFLLVRGCVRRLTYRRIGFLGFDSFTPYDVTGTRIIRLRLLPHPEVRKRT